jgi:hypothetical protein
MLRDGWSPPVDLCAVQFSGSMPNLEVIVRDIPLLAGAWSHKLTVDGRPSAPTGDWKCVCWFVDKTCAYVELQIVHNEIQVVRQALLVRGESVLLLADSVRSPERAQIEFERSTPLVAGWSDEQDGSTRELALIRDKHRVRVFPVTAAQPFTERSQETTRVEDGQLRMNVQSDAARLYVATLFDWFPKRRDDPADWSRLTVAENGQPVPPADAVGYRLRVGKSQWLLYHSLVPPQVPRTVLGLHSNSESVLSRLDADGELQKILEVEPD